MTRRTIQEPSNQLFYNTVGSIRHGRVRDIRYAGSAAMSSSTSSASKTGTYCSISGPGPPTYYVDQPATNTLRSYHNPERYSGSSTASRTVHQVIPSKHHGTAAVVYGGDERSSSSASATRIVYYNRPSTMVSISNVSSAERRPTSANSNLSTEGIVYPCGGHCRTFERCFHYFLQFSFVIGILAGISLVLAAYRLHYQRPAGDQLVLVYIGVLITLVCTLLLSIQCSVEREVKRKKRKRRIAILLAKNNRNRLQASLRTAETERNAPVYTEMTVVAPVNHQPAPPMMTTYCQMPLITQDYQYSTQHNSISNEDMDRSQNGVPWWRKDTIKNENVV